MQGDIVKAAKWLCGGMVLASLILVVGFRPTVTGRVVTFSRVQPVSPDPPVPATVAPASYYPVLAPPPAAGGLPAASN